MMMRDIHIIYVGVLQRRITELEKALDRCQKRRLETPTVICPGFWGPSLLTIFPTYFVLLQK